ncbi:MAG: 4Fe-4S single cluster domain [Alphaproteobacteria bacterium]|jgi:ferredoxin|nr:4Fe-4S single cluster domain [Alphaproteobacteria bacterium]
MTKLNVAVDHGKCQGYGACVKIAPEVFRLNANNNAEAGNVAAAPDEVVLKAARCCPYRAVTVTDADTGAQLIPRVRASS